MGSLAERDSQVYFKNLLEMYADMDSACIKLSLEICLEAAKLYDMNGGIKKYKDARKKKQL